MAKGNNGNYLQHSVEVELAVRLASMDRDGLLHVSLAHGMAPFEACDEPRPGQTRALLEQALSESCQPSSVNEPAVVAAYRATSATFEHYPNSAELLRGVIGSNRLSGGITEVDQRRYAQLATVWARSEIVPQNSSWRSQVYPGGVLACPSTLDRPWLFTLDPMTYREDGDEDDNNVHRADLRRLVEVLKPFVQCGNPGVGAIFVYAVKPEIRPLFWRFVDELAAGIGASVTECWLTHQGGNRNLAALLCSRFEPSSRFPPAGITMGRD